MLAKVDQLLTHTAGELDEVKTVTEQLEPERRGRAGTRSSWLNLIGPTSRTGRSCRVDVVGPVAQVSHSPSQFEPGGAS
jgi:hypothetical protein